VSQEDAVASSKESLKNCTRASCLFLFCLLSPLIQLPPGDFTTAQDLVKQAVDNVPSSWTVMAMGIVESATNLAVAAGNAYISTAVSVLFNLA
jgi:hypothetical protein